MELTLKTFLTWVLVGGGGSVLVRWIFTKIPAMQQKSEPERAIYSGLLTGGLVAGAFVATVFAGYTPMPDTVLAWIENLFAYVATAVGLPALMSVTMRGRFEAESRSGGVAAATAESNRLWGILW